MDLGTSCETCGADPGEACLPSCPSSEKFGGTSVSENENVQIFQNCRLCNACVPDRHTNTQECLYYAEEQVKFFNKVIESLS